MKWTVIGLCAVMHPGGSTHQIISKWTNKLSLVAHVILLNVFVLAR